MLINSFSHYEAAFHTSSPKFLLCIDFYILLTGLSFHISVNSSTLHEH